MISRLKRHNELRRARPLLGTFVDVRAGGAEESRLQEAVERAFHAVERVHRLMNVHADDSEVSRLNRFGWRRSLAVHPATYAVLETAQRMSMATQGLFDCTVETSRTHPRRGDWRDIDLLPCRRVRFRGPLRVDLSGIAKGFAVDRAVAALEAAGVPYGCVNAGGDLRVFGEQSQPVYLRCPGNPGRVLFVREVSRTAVATSAPYFASTLINPRSRARLTASRSVSIFAPSCMIADALTKAVLFSPTPPRDLLARFRADAVLLEGDVPSVAVLP